MPDSVESLEAQIAELEAKKHALEEEEARKARSIHITIHKFNPIAGKIHLTLSKYRPDIVDYLRYYMDRAWVGDESSNIVSTFNLEHHLEELERKGDVILQWNKNDKRNGMNIRMRQILLFQLMRSDHMFCLNLVQKSVRISFGFRKRLLHLQLRLKVYDSHWLSSMHSPIVSLSFTPRTL
jgi:hypothetical protein